MVYFGNGQQYRRYTIELPNTYNFVQIFSCFKMSLCECY